MLKQGKVSSSSDQTFVNFTETIHVLLIGVCSGSVDSQTEQQLGTSQVVFREAAKPFHVRPEIQDRVLTSWCIFTVSRYYGHRKNVQTPK